MSILGMFFERTINIGFVPNINPMLQHGVAWLKTPGAGMISQPFTVDKPEMLEEPRFEIVDQLFRQIAKMGYYPDKIELIANDEYLVYEFGKIRPVIRQRKL